MIFLTERSAGYGYQFTRNNFQLNRRNGQFSEVGLYSGIAATDWSWAPLWFDFDNDGWKDLFISNGIPKRLNDIDYINFVSNSEIQQRITTNKMEEKNMALINKFPQIKVPNKFYVNNHDLSFKDETDNVVGQKDTYSNGAAFADLDEDGDLDIVVNNIDDAAIVYENTTNSGQRTGSFTLMLEGPANNKNAVGARVIVYSGNEIRTYEKYPVRGFISSMEGPLLIGTLNSKIDSILLIWPDNGYQRIPFDNARPEIRYSYAERLPQFDFNAIKEFSRDSNNLVTDVTNRSGLQYLHKENHFVEFDRESLLPHMFSTEGPAIAVGDINRDGLDDIFLGSARNEADVVFVQQAAGTFVRTNQPQIDADSSYETTGAVWADLNNDGYPDLVAVSGGNEFYGPDIHNTPRVYLNNKNLAFEKKKDAFDTLFLTAATVAAWDFTGDGYTDLFIGAKTIPWNYGAIPRSYLLQNDGTGKFKDVTEEICSRFESCRLYYQRSMDRYERRQSKRSCLFLRLGKPVDLSI